MLKNKWVKLAGTVLIICIVVFFLMNSAGIFSDKIITARAEQIVSAEYITKTGYLIRNEKVITVNSDYEVSPQVSDGERVRKDTVIAKLYDKGADLSIVSKISSLEERLASLKELNAGNLSYKQDALRLENDINNLILQNVKISQSGNFEDLKKNTETLLHYFNIKQVLLGYLTNFDNEINETKTELDRLKSQMPTVRKTVTANEIGFFTTGFDGYENKLTFEELTSMSVVSALDYVKSLTPDDKPDGYIGKTITSGTWRMFVPMDAETVLKYVPGSSVKVSIPALNNRLFTATVIYTDNFKQDGYIILEGILGPEAFVNHRELEIKILKSSSECFAISSTALIQNAEGVTGVYVLVGQQIVFKPVEFLKFEGELAYIRPVSGSNTVTQYDEIIISGKNLFDGKII